MAKAIPAGQTELKKQQDAMFKTKIVNLCGDNAPVVDQKDFLNTAGELPQVITILTNGTIKVDY